MLQELNNHQLLSNLQTTAMMYVACFLSKVRFENLKTHKR